MSNRACFEHKEALQLGEEIVFHLLVSGEEKITAEAYALGHLTDMGIVAGFCGWTGGAGVYVQRKALFTWEMIGIRERLNCTRRWMH